MVKATITPLREKKVNLAKELEQENPSVAFSLCDARAVPAAHHLAAYLQAASGAHVVLYGHQNDLHRKAGKHSWLLSESDTYDVTGHYAAVNGIDALSLVGTEHGKWYWPQKKRIAATVALATKTAKHGSIVTLSAHMPNFAFIKERLANGTDGVLKDGSVNFSGYTPNNLRGEVVVEILNKSTSLHSVNNLFNAYLDMVCDFCHALQKKDIAVIWRPFHENTGGWFWWGCNSCTPEQFVALWRYTFHYMVDVRGVHNLIWAYSPGSENKNSAQFFERYPGDEYVDLIGFDMYERLPEQKDSFFADYVGQLALLGGIARNHNKLFANTETGVAHEGNKALLDTGNEDVCWYKKILSCCADAGACYFLLWANFHARGAYYAPYVERKCGLLRRKMYGHELLDSFIAMYNDARSVFSGQAGLKTLQG